MYLDQPLHPSEAIAVPTDALGTSGITDGGFIGVEKQPFIQEVFLAFVYLAVNLVVDIAYAWLDPRIRYGR